MLNWLNRLQVRKVLFEFDRLSWFPEQDEIDTIKSIIDALEIVEAGTTDLCSLTETLASADQVGDSIYLYF